jgi:hypothetical protein
MLNIFIRMLYMVDVRIHRGLGIQQNDADFYESVLNRCWKYTLFM